MKKVLILTYYWPPAGGIAVQRFMKFAKYLPQYGWEPIIITVREGSYPYTDPRLEDEVPKGIEVHRTKTFEPFEIYNLLRGQKGKTVPLAVATASKKSLFQRLSGYIRANFFLPDARVGWKPFAIKEASKIISNQKIDAIITTGPPHSTHLIGQVLKAKYKLPWIADFRDPWTEIFNNQYLPFTESSKAKDKRMEASVLEDCDIATVIGEGMKSVFPETYRSKIQVITNGYDESDFNRNLKTDTDKFRMRYVGNLFSNQNITALWSAIAELRKQKPDFAKDFELELIGKVDSAVSDGIIEYGLQECTRYISFIPHQDAIAMMQSASILLSVIPNVANNKLIITGKIFEYMGSGRPIFLIGPPDCDAARIVSDSDTGIVHEYVDKNKMKTSLLYYYQKFKQGDNKVTPHNIEPYSREQLTAKLAAILNRLI
jgi:glycosyltransferase involved in cell wall biosynthesis